MQMTIFKPEGVEEEPFVDVYHWSFRLAESSDGCVTKHLVGNVNFVGRVSSPIMEILPNGNVLTLSGRVYKLRGSCGRDKDAEYVWSRWLSVNDCFERENKGENND